MPKKQRTETPSLEWIEAAIENSVRTVHVPAFGPGFRDVIDADTFRIMMWQIFGHGKIDAKVDVLRMARAVLRSMAAGPVPNGFAVTFSRVPEALAEVARAELICACARRVCSAVDEFGIDPGVLGFEIECLDAALDGSELPRDEAPPR